MCPVIVTIFKFGDIVPFINKTKQDAHLNINVQIVVIKHIHAGFVQKICLVKIVMLEPHFR